MGTRYSARGPDSRGLPPPAIAARFPRTYSGPYVAEADHGGTEHRLESERIMSQVRVHNFGLSIDGYGAGRNQGLKEPLGVGGEELHEWIFGTAYWHERTGESG